jgi:phenylacetate-CoA ligase
MTSPTHAAAEQHATRRFFHPDMETISRGALESLQFERLSRIIRIAYSKGALIRAKWDEAGVTPDDIRSLEDFRQKVPFISKDDLREWTARTGDPFGGLLCVERSALRQVTGTSGTTGDPTLLADTRITPPTSESMFHRYFWEAGLRPGDAVVICIPTTRGPAVKLAMDFGLVPLLLDHDPRELPRLVELARTYKPKAMLIMSTPLVIGLERLEAETGVDLRAIFEPMKMVAFGGEAPGGRALMLAERWGMKIINLVNAGDSSVVLDCSAQEGAHPWEDELLIEHIDPQTLAQSADGEIGELVVTTLDNDTDPLVRYRADDLVWLTRDPCKCGRTHARYKVMGRAGDEVMVDGKCVLPRDVGPIVESFVETKAGLYQLVRPQRVLPALRVRVGYDGSPDLDSLLQRLSARLAEALGLPVEVELCANQELLKQGPPHKIPRIVKS